MRRARALAALAAVLALSACAVGAPNGSPPSGGAPSGATSGSVAPSGETRASTPTPTPTPVDPIAALSLEQRVGQLFLVGTEVDRASRTTIDAVTERHAGGIFLHGRTHAGPEAVASVVERFTRLVPVAPGAPDGRGPTGGVRLWVATDQEGGEVQVIRGPGADDIPYAIRQADLPAAELRERARTWGEQLAAAGVDMNLAPIADIVTSHDARFSNPPIGALGRQYGYDRKTVAAKAGAFAAGMRDAGILPVFKHFPGLGHVTENTDLTARVVDTTVTAGGPDVSVYRPLTEAGPSAVMMSSAYYDRIDPDEPAAFSSRVVGLVRGEVGFEGVIMTDDLSAAAAAKPWPPAERALRALDAGVDVVLVSADAGVYAEMYDAVLERAREDAAFADLVDAAARRVVVAKAAHP